MDVFWQVYRKIHLALGTGPVNLEQQTQDHWEIYEAVANKDKALASERLQRHFDGIRLKLKDVAAASPAPASPPALHARRPGRAGLPAPFVLPATL